MLGSDARFGRLWRRRCPRWPLGLLLATLALSESARAQVGDLDVVTFRTRRGGGLTLVDGVVQFDPSVVQGGEDCGYEMRLEVRDATNTAILEDSWSALNACQAQGQQQPGRSIRIVETFQFAIKPGRYSVDVSVQPAGHPESARLAGIDLVNLAEDSPASDLILGRDVGFVDTTEASWWTVRKGEMGIAADPYVIADEERSTLAYYIEVYRDSGSELDAEVVGVISRQNGDEVVRTRLATLEGAEASQPIAGKLSLAGLPPGDYVMDVRLQLDDTTVTRSRGFGMASPLAVTGTTERGGSTETGLHEYFRGLTDEQLAELFDPIVVWLSSGRDRRMYEHLAPEGKRNFLIEYFEHVAPSLVGESESPLDVYLTRVRYLNEKYGEVAGREERAAWRTDRGRIYLLRGQPAERLSRTFPRDDSPPYEIWSYQSGPAYVYLFVDETRFNFYRLIFSTDPAETPLPDWQQRVGRVALTELDQYFGIRAEIRRD